MPPTRYDEVAPTYDARYERNRYAGISSTLTEFAGEAPKRILEVGCGSGHWLQLLKTHGHRVTGLDPSSGMLAKALAKVPDVPLVRGRAEELPFDGERFDRVLIVNALHHFADAREALREARRVLSPAGAVLTIGLDPSANQDEWCIYDYFRGTLEVDRKRFPSTATIRTLLGQAGFARAETFVAERIEQEVPAREALASGALARHFTSQLSELTDAAYAEGIEAIRRAAADAEARGETLTLRARLHLFGTLGRVSSAPQTTA